MPGSTFEAFALKSMPSLAFPSLIAHFTGIPFQSSFMTKP